MKVLLINSVCGVGSTGRICTNIADDMQREGHVCKIAYGRGSVPERYKQYAVRIGSNFGVLCHAGLSRAFNSSGFHSRVATKRFLKWAEEFDPDVVWLHNIHGYYINVPMLFAWIKSRPNMQVKWTLHDCWAFTGHCTHFTVVNCDRWKDVCQRCPQKRAYPASYVFDRARKNFFQKRTAFSNVNDMELIVPSQWLADLVKQSFLKEYPVTVSYNTIDGSTFKPTESDFRVRYGLRDKKIVLGVANVWTKNKGIDDFYRLAQRLDERYAIVLVGLSEKQMRNLLPNMIGITRTNSPKELAEIYTAADVFVNPSREETFGLTTVEAQSCGTKAIVYKDTACEEIVEKFGGVAVEQDVEYILKEISII